MIRPRFGDDVTAVLAIMCGAVLSFGVTGALLDQTWLSADPTPGPSLERPAPAALPKALAVPPDVTVIPSFDEPFVVTWAIIREPILMVGPEDEATGWAPEPTRRRPER